MDSNEGRPLAVVTGASSGIGLELAKQFARNSFDLVVAAEEARIDSAAAELRALGVEATGVQVDLATVVGVEGLYEQVRAVGRPVDAAAVNAGVGAGGPFVDVPVMDHLRLLGLNVTGAVHLTWLVLRDMLARGSGRLLFTSSIAATMPGPYEATYAASKAFLQSFAEAIRREVKDSGVTVTALMPGPTDTNFFERAGMKDTMVGQGPKDDPADVARDGFEAMMAGKDHVVAGSLRNRAQTAAAKVLPQAASAAMHGAMAKPRPAADDDD